MKVKKGDTVQVMICSTQPFHGWSLNISLMEFKKVLEI